MDVYHRILGKIYEITDGKQTESVDLLELVKQEGFLPSYEDISRQLNRSGWISDSGRGNKVKITHWGVKEAKKASAGTVDSGREVRKLATRLQEEIKELLVMAEELASDVTESKLKLVEKQMGSVAKVAEELKANI
jgi:hypothetical protein